MLLSKSNAEQAFLRILLHLNYCLKHLEIAFTSDGRQDKEIDVRSGKASAVMQALHDSVLKR